MSDAHDTARDTAGPHLSRRGLLSGAAALTVAAALARPNFAFAKDARFCASLGWTVWESGRHIVAGYQDAVKRLGGTLTINNGGPAFAVGNSFTLLSASTITGSFAAISPATPGAGLAWNTTGLSTGVLSVVSGVASNPTNISYSFNGNTLSLTWPADHLGWILQSQTNAATVGLITASNAWTDVSGSASSTSATITVDPTKPTVFYRLRQP